MDEIIMIVSWEKLDTPKTIIVGDTDETKVITNLTYALTKMVAEWEYSDDTINTMFVLMKMWIAKMREKK